MFINVALSSFTFLITTSFTAGPETLVPVDLSLVSRGELILAPGVITKVPVTFERLIGVMVSGKNCHKLNILEHENREICTFWQIWEFEIVVLSKKIIHFILMVWAHSPGNPQFGFGAQKNICGFWFDIGIWPPTPPPVIFCPKLESHHRPYMWYIFGMPWVQGPLWQCSGVSDMQIHNTNTHTNKQIQ